MRKLRAVGLVLAMTTAIYTGAASFAGEPEDALVIGEETGGMEYRVALCNETGKEIEAAALRVNYGDFSDNLIPEEETFPDGTRAVLICPQAEMINYVPPVYDLLLTFTDQNSAVLHTLPMGDAEEITLLLAERAGTGEAASEAEGSKQGEASDVAYIRFTSLSLAYETDTMNRERQIAEDGEQQMIADYEAKTDGGTAASGSTGTAAEDIGTAAEDTGSGAEDTGSASGDAGTNAGTGEAAAAPAGGGAATQEQCLTNGLVF